MTGPPTDPACRIATGLCSVTLRRLPPARVVELAAQAGLACVEWGADVHVPPGDAATAEAVRAHTEAAGLRVSGYGSYFRAGATDPAQLGAIVDTARRLGAPRIRLWAGVLGSAEATPADRTLVVAATRRLADAAGEAGIELAFEFHGGTLTDSATSTLDLLRDVARPNVHTYWQPPNDVPDAPALAGLVRVLPYVAAVHVFSWWPGTERLPLTRRASLWRAAFGHLQGARRAGLDALLEFVPGDDPALIAAEAATLRDLSGT